MRKEETKTSKLLLLDGLKVENQMSLTQNSEESLHLLELLKSAKKFNAVVMPGFFLGRLVTYEGDLNRFSKAIAKSNEKRETEIADQILQSFTNFFEVKSARDKRHEERKQLNNGGQLKTWAKCELST